MKNKPSIAAALLAAGLLSAGLAGAHSETYIATLLPNPAVPASTGSGSATITIDYDTGAMNVQASFSGLSGVTTISHIHCCTINPGVVSGAIVATQTPSFAGFPAGVTSGSYSHSFNLLLDASAWNSTFVTSFGGTNATALEALEAGLDAGKAYFNIHTSTVGSGEIQGFLTAAPVPETGSALMLGTGLLGLAAWLRRRRGH